MLEFTKDNFARLGANTAHFTLLGRTLVVTIEPENLKCVMASDFRNFCLGDDRKKLLKPFLGEGIFTTDGAE